MVLGGGGRFGLGDAAMHGLRLWCARNNDLALLIVALALCVKALVPPGYMVSTSQRAPVFYLCTSVPGAEASASASAVDIDAPKSEHSNADTHCAFSALTMGAIDLAAAFAVAALVFVFLLALRPQTLRPNIQRHWRLPPPCGPPITI